MTRLARLDASGILHHVIGRGIKGKRYFFAMKTPFLGREGASLNWAACYVKDATDLLVSFALEVKDKTS